ncbi:unnamed protein product [Moneuplotes crassus]|uniref:EamA domain-containing protein n=1 Tax=Euplotes crassus TaxID=5936 RepID=A0AAD2D9R6_EUPCR|nr:unnamed protein product [Moneuplotes crassus]
MSLNRSYNLQEPLQQAELLLNGSDAFEISASSGRMEVNEGSEVSSEKDSTENVKLAFRSKKDFVIGAFWLGVLIVSSATIGPIMLAMPAKSTYVSILWRSQSSCLFMAIWSAISYFKYSRQRVPQSYEASESRRLSTWEKMKKDSSPKNLVSFSFMSFFLFVWVFGLILGCKFTLTAHADVLYCNNGLFILLIAILTCQYVHKYEIIGYVVYGVGILVMISDPNATKTNNDMDKSLGNFLALTGALCGALYGIVSNKMKRDSPQEVCMFYLFLGHFIIQLIFFPQVEDNSLLFSFDPEYGMFGWLSDFWLFLLVFGFMCPWTSVLTNYSLLQSYKYWTLDIVAVSYLTEPYFAQIAAVLFGQDEIPGSQTFIGIIILSIGIILSIHGSKCKTLHRINSQSNDSEQSAIELASN